MNDIELKKCKKILVYGGSFDPTHWGHVRLPVEAMRAVGAGAVVYIPSGNQPLKNVHEQSESRHRLAMLRIALEGVEEAYIWTDEVDRAEGNNAQDPTYTVDTLERLRGKLGEGVEMRLLIGGDCVREWGKWRNTRRIKELSAPLVMVRPPDTAESLLGGLPQGEDRGYWNDKFLNIRKIEVSSTEIRRRIAAGESVEGMVPVGVERYIREHRLYGAGEGA